jgi:hypothetical protein
LDLMVMISDHIRAVAPNRHSVVRKVNSAPSPALNYRAASIAAPRSPHLLSFLLPF